MDYQLKKVSEVLEVKNVFKLDNDDWIHYFVRVRLANETKVALSYDYVVAKFIPKIDVTSLNSSFYDFLYNEYGIKPVNANFQVCALISDATINELLEIENEALLSVSHSSYLDSGEIFKYNRTFYLGKNSVIVLVLSAITN